MKKVLMWLALAGMTMSVAVGQKIGVVDMKAIADRSQKIKADLDRSQDQVRAQQEKLDNKMNELQKLRQDLNTRRAAMSQSEVNAQEEKLQTLRDEFDDMQKGLNRQINQIQRNVLRPQAERIQQIIGEVAKQQGFDLVLDAEAAIYHSEAIDITPMVVQIFDRESGKAAARPAQGETAPPTPAAGESPAGRERGRGETEGNANRQNRRGE